MKTQFDCYNYGRKIKSYLDGLGQMSVTTSFNKIQQTLGLPDDAVGRIALFSVPRYRTNYDASQDMVVFKRL